MAITVVTPATSRDLTTLSQVREVLPGLSASDESWIQSFLISAASRAVEDYCQRIFARETVQETVAGYGDAWLMLSRVPVVSVSSITYLGDTITDYTIEDPDAGLLYRENGWEWTTQMRWHLTGHPMPRSEIPRYTVQYTAGYLLPGDAGRNLPESVELAVLEAIKAWWGGLKINLELQAQLVQSVETGGAGVPAEYFTLPPLAARLLLPYRRI